MTGSTLAKRLYEASRQAQAQRFAHTQMSASFPAAKVEEWMKCVNEWSETPFGEDAVNPFEEPEPNVSVADVRRELNSEEEADLARGVVPDHAVSASKFIVTGLQLEDQQ